MAAVIYKPGAPDKFKTLKHYKARVFQGGSVICWFAQWKFAEEVQGAGLFQCPVQT